MSGDVSKNAGGGRPGEAEATEAATAALHKLMWGQASDPPSSYMAENARAAVAAAYPHIAQALGAERTFTEWGVRYEAPHFLGGYGYQMCDTEDEARDWQQYHPQPNEVVSRIVSFGPWAVAAGLNTGDRNEH